MKKGICTDGENVETAEGGAARALPATFLRENGSVHILSSLARSYPAWKRAGEAGWGFLSLEQACCSSVRRSLLPAKDTMPCDTLSQIAPACVRTARTRAQAGRGSFSQRRWNSWSARSASASASASPARAFAGSIVAVTIQRAPRGRASPLSVPPVRVPSSLRWRERFREKAVRASERPEDRDGFLQHRLSILNDA